MLCDGLTQVVTNVKQPYLSLKNCKRHDECLRVFFKTLIFNDFGPEYPLSYRCIKRVYNGNVYRLIHKIIYDGLMDNCPKTIFANTPPVIQVRYKYFVCMCAFVR